MRDLVQFAIRTHGARGNSGLGRLFEFQWRRIFKLCRRPRRYAPPGNSAPTISGVPSSSVKVDEQYSFTPVATDADNDPLTFSVQGEPNWLTRDSGNGALTGTPLLADVGTYSGITVSVSDGSPSTSLPQFSVDVVQNANGSITLS